MRNGSSDSDSERPMLSEPLPSMSVDCESAHHDDCRFSECLCACHLPPTCEGMVYDPDA